MSREQASAALARRQDELDRVTAALLTLDDHRGHKLLAGGELTGETRRRWESARGELTELWRTFDAYKRVLTRARERAEGLSGADARAELTFLLTGPSVELRVETPPLNRRPLLAPTSESITLDAAVTRMTHAYTRVADVVAAADEAWTPLLTRLNKADTHLKSINQALTVLATPPPPPTPGSAPTPTPGSAPAPGLVPAPGPDSASSPAPAPGQAAASRSLPPFPGATGPPSTAGGSGARPGFAVPGVAGRELHGPHLSDHTGARFTEHEGPGPAVHSAVAGSSAPGAPASPTAASVGSGQGATPGERSAARADTGVAGAGEVRDADAERLAQALETLRRDVLADPLAFVRDGRCDTSRADALVADLAALGADLAAARRLRDGYPERVAGLDAAIAEVAAAEARARGACELARTKIHDPGLPPLPEAAPDLRVRLRSLTVPPAPAPPGTGAVARWRRRAADVAELERETSGARHAAAAVEQHAAGLVDRRNELRGRLDAYRAKALRYGLAEDEDLSAAARQARDLLWTAPCDLRAATRAVAAYVHAFDARRVLSGGAPGAGGTAGRPGESQE